DDDDLAVRLQDRVAAFVVGAAEIGEHCTADTECRIEISCLLCPESQWQRKKKCGGSQELQAARTSLACVTHGIFSIMCRHSPVNGRSALRGMIFAVYRRGSAGGAMFITRVQVLLHLALVFT